MRALVKLMGLMLALALAMLADMVKPIIPQTKLRFTGQKIPRVPPSIGATVGLLVTHDWGPLGSELDRDGFRPLAGFDEWVAKYGDSDTSGRTAVAQAFLGHGTPSGGGAGGVVVYRMDRGAVRASVRILNATTRVAALTLTAKWAGTRGNDISYAIDADPSNVGRDRLRILFRGAVVETYLYARTDVTALAASINARDTGWITAAMTRTGEALTTTGGTSLASGANGATLDSSAYLAAAAGMEFRSFTILAAENLIDDTVQAAILEWVQEQEEQNRPVVWVVGGRGDETLDDAISRSTALADAHVVNFGVGLYQDDLLDQQLSTAQLAPRLAGILAARGKRQALTAAELGGLHAIGTTGVSIADAEVAMQNGVTVAIRTESPDADLRIAKGVTTFTDDTDEDHPLEIYGEPRFMRINDLYIRDMRMWGDRTMIGNVTVTDDTRDAVRQQGNILMDALIADGLILTRAGGASIDPFIRTPVTTDDTLPFEFGWQYARTLNYLLGEGKVR